MGRSNNFNTCASIFAIGVTGAEVDTVNFCAVRQRLERPVSETGVCEFESHSHNLETNDAFGDPMDRRLAFEASFDGSNPSPRVI